jgi:hypothetical protein
MQVLLLALATLSLHCAWPRVLCVSFWLWDDVLQLDIKMQCI